MLWSVSGIAEQREESVEAFREEGCVKIASIMAAYVSWPSMAIWIMVVISGPGRQSSPENRSQAACLDTPSTSPIRVQVMPRLRRTST
jgi:hypothetical protein